MSRRYTLPELHDAHLQARASWARAWIADRADEDGDCLVWTLGTNNQGAPMARVDGDMVNVRRWLFACTTARLRAGIRVVAECGNPRCLAHLVPMTGSELNKWIAKRGGYSTPARRLASRRSARAVAKYTEDQVRAARELRGQGLKLHEVEARTGVPWHYVSQIFLGKAWSEQMPGASAFTRRAA